MLSLHLNLDDIHHKEEEVEECDFSDIGVEMLNTNSKAR